MITKTRRLSAIAAIGIFTLIAALMMSGKFAHPAVSAQASPTPTPPAATPAPEFDQKAALAKLREQIKGREQESASAVFKNIQTMKNRPAGQVLAVMEFGYARSLGVTCTHCHVPDKWESEEKPQKQIARDMSAMAGRINTELLKGIKNLKSESPVVNCTTCHRGQVVPATNLPVPPKG